MDETSTNSGGTSLSICKRLIKLGGKVVADGDTDLRDFSVEKFGYAMILSVLGLLE